MTGSVAWLTPPRPQFDTAMDDQFRNAALDYHRTPVAGKIAVVATKDLVSQSDLALAYTPGVALACEAIVADEGAAAIHRPRQSVAGITNARRAGVAPSAARGQSG